MVTRRAFVKLSVAGGIAAATGSRATAGEQQRVRDHLWIWTHHPGVYDGMFGLPRNSRITPVDAAKYLGAPNIMFIRASGQPPYPFEDYAAAFKDVKNLQRPITGSGGDTSNEEREYVLKLAASMPNITGLYMDDFFNFARQDKEASMSVDEVRAIRERMIVNGRQLELGVVVYSKDKFDERMLPYLELCDAVSLWFWSSDELENLEKDFARLHGIAPRKRIQMGCYMWDYGVRNPMALDRLERQCNQGLRWLKEKRIADMIFRGAHLCGQGLEAVEWTRNWIAETGDELLRPHTAWRKTPSPWVPIPQHRERVTHLVL